MQRITGHFAQACAQRETAEPYKKREISEMSDHWLKISLCSGSYYSGCSKCVCYDVCQYGKEAVRRGMRK